MGRLWSDDEVDALKRAMAKHGAGKWKEIKNDPEFAKSLEHRSTANMKDKFRQMEKDKERERERELLQLFTATSSSSSATLLSTPATTTTTTTTTTTSAKRARTSVAATSTTTTTTTTPPALPPLPPKPMPHPDRIKFTIVDPTSKAVITVAALGHKPVEVLLATCSKEFGLESPRLALTCNGRALDVRRAVKDQVDWFDVIEVREK